MNANASHTDADDLAQALQDTAPHIVIPSVHEHEPIDVDTYREKLRKVRSVHDVDDAQFVSMFRPVVGDSDKRSRVFSRPACPCQRASAWGGSLVSGNRPGKGFQQFHLKPTSVGAIVTMTVIWVVKSLAMMSSSSPLNPLSRSQYWLLSSQVRV